jgi:type VI secretion system Hcp family effector
MYNFFLNIEGLPGEELDATHPGWIALLSFSWGVSQPGIMGGAGSAFQDFLVVKVIDRTSPDLALACATGRRFASMTVEVSKPQSGPFLIYQFNDCTVTSLSPGFAAGVDQLHEQVSFSYAEIEWRYAEQRSDGTLGDTIARSFSVARNQPQLDRSGVGGPEASVSQPSPSAQVHVHSYVRNTAFILMWMDADNAELEDIHLTIKDVCKGFGITALRADDVQHDERITDVILERIRSAEFVIADLTGARPNVYYEIGHAHAIGKRPILVRKKGSPLHFDLAVHNVREYRNVTELRDLLTKRLDALVR